MSDPLDPLLIIQEDDTVKIVPGSPVAVVKARTGAAIAPGKNTIIIADTGPAGTPAQKFSANIGNGSLTSITVTHNFGTRDVHVEVYKNSGNFDTVECDIQRPSTNAVTLLFATAPATNSLRVVVLA